MIVVAAGIARAEPVIRSIRPKGTNLLVTVSVDDAARRITLEGRPRLGPEIGRGHV